MKQQFNKKSPPRGLAFAALFTYGQNKGSLFITGGERSPELMKERV